jgi:hypothetical protein
VCLRGTFVNVLQCCALLLRSCLLRFEIVIGPSVLEVCLKCASLRFVIFVSVSPSWFQVRVAHQSPAYCHSARDFTTYQRGLRAVLSPLDSDRCIASSTKWCPSFDTRTRRACASVVALLSRRAYIDGPHRRSLIHGATAVAPDIARATLTRTALLREVSSRVTPGQQAGTRTGLTHTHVQ